MTLSSSDVLFIGSGSSALSWYRCGQPSLTLGCDFAGVIGSPEDLRVVTSLKRGAMDAIDWDSYKIVVLQQVVGIPWLNHIRALQQKGIKVLYEIDDYVQGVRKVNRHSSAHKYTKKHCEHMELCMAACDGMIVTTEFLAQRYRKFNERIWICRNSIEGRRYQEFSPPSRGDGSLHIGWAGGEGHWDDVVAWMPAVERILDEFPRVRFGTIGKRVGQELPERLHHRMFELPFVSIENYPGALCNFDIALAPSSRNDFFKGKSDLRWVECGALGIPVVADPWLYSDTQHGITAMHAATWNEAYVHMKTLIEDREVREYVARKARQEVFEKRTIEVMCDQWIKVFTEL